MAKKSTGKLRIIPLGGLSEIGKNITVIEYENDIIHLTIDSLKENSINFGIPEDIVNLVDTDSLADIIRTILNNNKPDAFSVLDAKTIEDNQKILDPEVVEVFSNAVETEPSCDTQANEKTEE